MKGLVISSPWIDLILSGAKTWEMRTKHTANRGRIALIKAKSGLIYGTAELVDCLPALSLEQMRQTKNLHGIPDEQITSAIERRWTTPWVLRDVVRFPSPKPYRHPNGAVTWVTLPDEVQDIGALGRTSTKPPEYVESIQLPMPPPAPKAVAPSANAAEWVDIVLTDGNIRNGHFYLRAAARLLPADCIGGSNKSQLGANIRVRFEPGTLAETDIAGDKMILRARAQVRDFLARSGAKAGDSVRFGRTGHHDFVATLKRAGKTCNPTNTP